MGRKVHPYGFRLGYIRDWKARWYAERGEYGDLLAEDLKVRQLIRSRKGQSVNALRKSLEEMTGKKVHVDVEEVERPELDARLVAEGIAQQIERRISFRRAMKQAVQRAMRFGAEGAMVTCAGRLFGAEMARSETTREGRVPRHTLRADIDYAHTEASTTYGQIGIKVWIYKGEVLPEKESVPEAAV